MFEPGDIFVTRNANEDDNGNPGYWNHIAILTIMGIVEAQMPPWDTIICNTLYSFFNRYPQIQAYRWNAKIKNNKLVCAKPIDQALTAEIRLKASQKAITMIGGKYRLLASIFPNLRKFRGDNCITVVRKAYKDACDIDPKWRIPDDITKDKRLIFLIEKTNR
jgi:hypothetical protein